MKIEVDIPEEVLEEPVKDAITLRLHQIIRQVVDKKITAYTDTIENAVEVYLAKRLTDVDIKNQIDKAVATIIEETLKYKDY